MKITDTFYVYFKESCIGVYFYMSDGSSSYSTGAYCFIGLEKEDIPASFRRSAESKGRIAFLERLMTDESRVPDTKRPVYVNGNITIKRVPKETGERYTVFRMNAGKGEQGYSERKYSVPHSEDGKVIEGMNEWVSWYCFNKMDDGTYEAELDEAWWWGGGHNDGGTIHAGIPEEWFGLPYGGFLEKVVTLASAAHYGFTAEELERKQGLREFFGYR